MHVRETVIEGLRAKFSNGPTEATLEADRVSVNESSSEPIPPTGSKMVWFVGGAAVAAAGAIVIFAPPLAPVVLPGVKVAAKVAAIKALKAAAVTAAV
ncbi:hypothetical protein [Methylobacterium aquaticum]|uniref:hypothetical protein n=1 Tax=Methylobacterium aquaticum TaxID=270351 RepID=UPI001932F643|nr:hypothetical protein [Methylobacterium aquaticum]QRE75436.1 hypothetical protein F1D61_19195 [Methylobacterium aquaticum]